MEKEEKFILEKCGNRRPFTTPEGYFENLTANIMSALPANHYEEPTKVSFWNKAKVWAYMAASFVGIFFVINTAVNIADRHESGNVQTASIESSVYSDEYIEAFFESTLIDDYTLYCSLTNTGDFSQL